MFRNAMRSSLEIHPKERLSGLLAPEGINCKPHLHWRRPPLSAPDGRRNTAKIAQGSLGDAEKRLRRSFGGGRRVRDIATEIDTRSAGSRLDIPRAVPTLLDRLSGWRWIMKSAL